MKFLILIVSLMFSHSAFSNNAILRDLERWQGSGEAREFTSAGDANMYCKSKYGTRLPTIRELANFAQSRGARGFIPLDQCDTRWGYGYPGHDMINGLQHGPVFYINSISSHDKSQDEFCFDMAGYKPEVPEDSDLISYSRPMPPFLAAGQFYRFEQYNSKFVGFDLGLGFNYHPFRCTMDK